ncbi:unnamed protein product [Didymodactylos carnosus]|uniref:Uncharacterized protein n=1 Tax=Didymodactylos carnosus TaxID=1234261 RepID=A0A815HWN8_9BILA|nr:unnamed protein product [Didymodactylos carnosus]CAF4237008.1 unnamed protein product [Didymodactylos carnosus]
MSLMELHSIRRRSDEYSQSFILLTTWKEIVQWLKLSPYLRKISNTYEYIFWNKNRKCVVSEDDTITLTIDDIDDNLISGDHQTATINFSVVDKNLVITVTIRNKNDDDILKLNCSKMLTIGRLCDISCLLFNGESKYYRLDDSEGYRLDEKDTLDNLNEEANEFQFQFICKAQIKRLIKNSRTALPFKNITR